MERAKKMSRKSRLQAAKTWLSKYSGTHPVLGYKKHFGIDILCAIKELKILGHPIDPQYEKSVIQTLTHQPKEKKTTNTNDNECLDSDQNFSFIAGYTSGGVPFGLTWEEWDGKGS